MRKASRILALCPMAFSSVLMLGTLCVPQAHADGFSLGNAANFGLLFEGAGGNTLQITNVTVNGNVGVGLTGQVNDGGPSTINGTIYFSAANTGQFHNNNGSNTFGGPVYSSTSGPFDVTGALNTVNALNSTLGADPGTNININGSTTINASAGVLDANGNRVFTVTGFNTTNSDVLTITGSATDHVVLNFTSSANFNNQVKLSGGITAGNVLYNFVGGSGLTGGPTLQINDNASSSASNLVQGIFLDPNGAISVVNANVLGQVFGGDTHDFQYVSGATITTTTSVPEPSTLILLATGLFVMTGLASRRKVRLA
jgi:hypothetical protein